MRPIAQSEGHYAPWLVDELVPSVAAVVDDVVVGFENAVREPIVAHELPYVLGRVQFGAFGRQGKNGDVFGHGQLGRHVPASLIEKENRVFAGSDGLADFLEMQVHRFGVAEGQNERRAFAVVGADRAENIGRGGALILRGRWPRSPLGPTARDLVLLTDARLVGKPDFQRGDADAFLQSNLEKARGEFFLKSSIAPSARA